MKLLRNNAGAAAIEYAMFLSLIGVVLVLALQALQIRMSKVYTTVVASIHVGAGAS